MPRSSVPATRERRPEPIAPWRPDRGARPHSSSEASTMSEKELPLWEVFVRSKQGLDHKHCGSLHAADAQMALRMARDVYTRRMEGVSLWVVPSAAITGPPMLMFGTGTCQRSVRSRSKASSAPLGKPPLPR